MLLPAGRTGCIAGKRISPLYGRHEKGVNPFPRDRNPGTPWVGISDSDSDRIFLPVPVAVAVAVPVPVPVGLSLSLSLSLSAFLCPCRFSGTKAVDNNGQNY